MASAERGKKLINRFTSPPEALPYSPLTAITAIDGRDRKYSEPLAPYMSEYGLQRTRLEVLQEYLIALSEIGVTPRRITSREKNTLRGISAGFTIADAEIIKQIEAVENHDVRAAQKFMRLKLKESTLSDLVEYSGISITSEDITGNALRINIARAVGGVMVPALDKIAGVLDGERHSDKPTPMQGRTHGMPATPTTAEKEFANYEEWLLPWIDKINNTKLTGKLNGAVGNWNSHRILDGNVDWINFSRKFIRSLGLEPRDYTIQINPYDDIISQLYNFAIVNGVLSGVASNMWHYISDGWIKQIPKAGESGSSAMPQKVNPIYFEKAEGKMQESIDIIHGLGRRLLETRFQRDLRDSTQSREIGAVFAHSLAGYEALLEGFSRVEVDRDTLGKALSSDWTVLSEPLQIFLRKETDISDPYELIKKLVRGRKMTGDQWRANVVDQLPISGKLKREIKEITPYNYLGYAVELAEGIPDEVK